MNLRILRYTLFVLVGLIVFSCRQAKYVPPGKYLHKKNEILFETVEDGDTSYKDSYAQIDDAEMHEHIRPTVNKKVKLFFYNRIDSARYAKQLQHKRDKYKKKNAKIQEKDSTINAERIKKAKAKGKDTYNHREKKLKNVKNGWRDWIVVKLGEPPVILDTSLVRKSTKQLDIYMSKHGFFDATVSDTIIYKEKKQKAFVEYTVIPGQPYIIDTISLHSSADANMRNMYRRFLENDLSVIEEGALVDEYKLDIERENFSKYCRDEAAFFEFTKGYITFEMDTIGKGHNVSIIMFISPKGIPDPSNPDSTIYVPHRTHKVTGVTFLLYNPFPDTLTFKYGYSYFKKHCDSLGLPPSIGGKFTLLDTIVNIDTVYLKGEQKIINKGVFVYNEIPYLNPDLIDKQNFLEIWDPKYQHFAKEYYIERSYRTMLGLDVFSSITPIVIIDPRDPLGTNVLVTYHLVPAKRQTFTIEPRVTNANSILGISGAVSYTNKNLFRGAQKLKVSFIGGLESQPLIVSEGGTDQRVWELNTFEWGPTILLSFPKPVPFPKKLWAKTSKRAFPSTVFELTVNFQKRVEFRRKLAYFSYEWNFRPDKTQEIKLKWINFNFVRLEKTPEFQLKLDQLNDPFLSNSYADHFSLFNQIEYKFNNQRLLEGKKRKNIHDYKATIIQSGGILNATGLGVLDTSTGLKRILGVPFTQFIKMDNQYIFNLKISKKHKLVTRVLAGFGLAYGNSPSLPYEQSFFAGGANDIRAFSAKTMAPGGTRIYEDSLATTTQIGDLRLEWNIEYRFYITDVLEGAFFVDMGNIWKLKGDPGDPGVFHFNSFLSQVAIGPGIGLRADLVFLVLRLDVAAAIHNPYLPAGERWVGQPKSEYKSYWDLNGNGGLEKNEIENSAYPYINPYDIKFNIGIGYPF